jgi:hypothetical protein
MSISSSCVSGFLFFSCEEVLVNKFDMIDDDEDEDEDEDEGEDVLVEDVC